jgi:hypothetical protein
MPLDAVLEKLAGISELKGFSIALVLWDLICKTQRH